MRLAEPGWLVLLVLVPLPWLLIRARQGIAWPTLGGFRAEGRFRAACKSALPPLLKGLAIGCVVVALARPQTVGGQTRVAGRGVAVVVALDQSSSMNTSDFPNGSDAPALTRLDAARRTLARFIAGRGDDLVGLVVFANYPDLACPPTLDHAFLLESVRAVRPARPGDDGTNLGDALIWSLDALKDASTIKKVVILLTDGRNSPAVPHPTDPVEAARIARRLGVTVHTIAVGRAGGLVHASDPITKLDLTTEVEGPDRNLLEQIARAGGGTPFTANDADALGRVFASIDLLEKSPIRGATRTRYREGYVPWTAAALGLFLLDRLLSAGPLRRLP